MAETCLRPGCTKQVDVIGVCVSCAQTDYDAREDGVQFRNENGQFVSTGGVCAEYPLAPLRAKVQP